MSLEQRATTRISVSIATGRSEPVPGRELHPLKSSAFHGALLRQLSSFAGSVPFSALIVFLGWTAPEFSRPSLGCRLLVGD
jgi:hypothetical protein